MNREPREQQTRLNRFGRKRKKTQAQTTVMVVLALGVIITFVGLAVDSGLLFLAKARLTRAADGAVLAAVGNFHRSDMPDVNRHEVAVILRNFAVANYPDLGFGLATDQTTELTNNYTTPTGQTEPYYVRTFLDGSQPDANGVFRRFVKVTLYTGTAGQITSAICELRVPVTTYFITTLLPGLAPKMRVSATATAKRNPRLIVVIIDRSASMLDSPAGGAVGLAPAINTFLNFFDPSYDTVGIVSFSSNSRVEVAPTTNFLQAETNVLYDTYVANDPKTAYIPDSDPEQRPGTAQYDPHYTTTGVRRLKFGGDTGADDGIRLALEQIQLSSGFADPDVNKIFVIFTDGAWNNARTLWAAPGYTNIVSYVAPNPPTTNVSANPFSASYVSKFPLAFGRSGDPYLQVPNFTDWSNYQYTVVDTADSQLTNFVVSQHTNDQFQSIDPSSTNEPFSPTGATTLKANHGLNEGIPITILKTNTLLFPNGPYSKTLDVWLQPGAIDFDTRPNAAHNGYITNVYISDFTDPTQEQQIEMEVGSTNTLQVPGYLVDGLVYDGFDLEYPSNASFGEPGLLNVRADNYLMPFMWPDDGAPSDGANPAHFASTTVTAGNSTMRRLLFRNYANLLTGYLIFRPDDPETPYGEPLDPTEQYPAGYPRRSYGLGAYYPSAGFYWPFDRVGASVGLEYELTNAVADPSNHPYDLNGYSRFLDYSINMLSPDATPGWAGELFYSGTGGSSTYSDENFFAKNQTTNVSYMVTNVDQWQNNLPNYAQAFMNNMTNDPPSNLNLHPFDDKSASPANWRPSTFIGQTDGSMYLGTPLDQATWQADAAAGIGLITAGANHWVYNNQVVPGSGKSKTGGYVVNGTGYKIYYNSEAWSGRPTHYFDISSSTWKAITNNHNPNQLTLPLGIWKAREYAWHARQLGVKIFTVGYGQDVNAAEQLLLAQVANATNTTAYYPTNSAAYSNGLEYDSKQPVGQQFYARTADDISNDFYKVGQAVNASLTQ